MNGDTWNPLQGVFDLIGRKIDADASNNAAASSTFDQGTAYGVDEWGRAYPRGGTATTPATMLGQPVVLAIGAGILLVLFLALRK